MCRELTHSGSTVMAEATAADYGRGNACRRGDRLQIPDLDMSPDPLPRAKGCPNVRRNLKAAILSSRQGGSIFDLASVKSTFVRRRITDSAASIRGLLGGQCANRVTAVAGSSKTARLLTVLRG